MGKTIDLDAFNDSEDDFVGMLCPGSTGVRYQYTVYSNMVEGDNEVDANDDVPHEMSMEASYIPLPHHWIETCPDAMARYYGKYDVERVKEFLDMNDLDAIFEPLDESTSMILADGWMPVRVRPKLMRGGTSECWAKYFVDSEEDVVIILWRGQGVF